MKYKYIPSFENLNKSFNRRVLPDNILAEASNIIFENMQVKTRWGYVAKGTNLPLGSSIQKLLEYKKLREDEQELIAITGKDVYLYDESTDIWEVISSIYNTGSAGSCLVGPKETFASLVPSGICTCRLDDTHIVVAYADHQTPAHGLARIAVVDGDIITSWGTAVEFGTDVEYLNICALSDVKFVVAYRDGSSSDDGTAKVGNVAGTTITYGVPLNPFNTNPTSHIDIAALDSTHVVLIYRDAGISQARCKCGSVVVDTITYGSHRTCNPYDANYCAICIIDSTHFVASWVEIGWPDPRLRVRGGRISGTAIEWPSSSPVIFRSADVREVKICALDATHFVLAYVEMQLLSTFGYCHAGVMDLSTSQVSGGFTRSGFGGIVTEIDICRVADSGYVVIWGELTIGKAQKGNLSGTTIESWGDEILINSSYIQKTAIEYIDEEHIFIAFSDSGTTDYGVAEILFGGVTGNGTSWLSTWPDDAYEIKFGTNDPDGTGSPDIWFNIHDTLDTTHLLLDVLFATYAASGDYVIKMSFETSEGAWIDACNTIEGLGGDDDKWLIVTNGIDNVAKYTGTGNLEALGGCLVKAKYAISYYGHLLLGWCIDISGNNLPQSIYWSDRGEPEIWSHAAIPGSAGYVDLLQGDDWITGLVTYKQRVFVFKEDSIVECRYTGLVSPAFDFLQDKIRGIGSPYPRTIINTGDSIIFLGRDNVYIFNGIQIKAIGQSIIYDLFDNMNEDYRYKTFAHLIARKFLYCLGIVTTGTEPSLFYVYDYYYGTWTKWNYGQYITAAASWGDYSIVLGDSLGYIYEMDFTQMDDNGIDISASFETKDYALGSYKMAFRLLETIIVAERFAGAVVKISASTNYGTTWSPIVMINLDTVESVYDHVQNWDLKGEKVRFRIENVEGAEFVIESLNIGYQETGISLGK